MGQQLAEAAIGQFKAEGAHPKRICALVWGKDSTGQFRDLFKDQAALMDRAFRTTLAASYYSITDSNPGLRPALDAAVSSLAGAGAPVRGNDPLEQNNIARNWVKAAEGYLAAGKGAGEAGELAITRIFAPPEGS